MAKKYSEATHTRETKTPYIIEMEGTGKLLQTFFVDSINLPAETH